MTSHAQGVPHVQMQCIYTKRRERINNQMQQPSEVTYLFPEYRTAQQSESIIFVIPFFVDFDDLVLASRLKYFNAWVCL